MSPNNMFHFLTEVTKNNDLSHHILTFEMQFLCGFFQISHFLCHIFVFSLFKMRLTKKNNPLIAVDTTIF